MICDEDSDAFLKMLYLMPAGLVAKSMALEGLTVASQNLAAVKTQEDGRLYILYSLRSSVNSFLDDMGEKIDLLCHVFGAEAIFRPGFPTWEYTAKSCLLYTSGSTGFRRRAGSRCTGRICGTPGAVGCPWRG